MKILKLTLMDGRSACLATPAPIVFHDIVNGDKVSSWVSEVGYVQESVEQIAAMLAEEPPQKSALEAAAPELLAALKGIVGGLHKNMDGWSFSLDHGSIEKAEAAIDAAEGRS